MSDFENKLNKIKEKNKGKVAKGSFGLTFNRMKNNKNNIKKKTSFLRKRKRVIIIQQRYIIYKRPIYKNLKAYYYAFLKIAPKKKTLSTRT